MIPLLMLSTILGLVFAGLSIQNAALTVIQIAGYSFSLPLYLLMAGVFVFGVAISYIFHLFDSAGAFFDIHNRDDRITQLERTSESLQHENDRLMKENLELNEALERTVEKMREGKATTPKEQIRNFWSKIHRPALS